MKLQHTNDPDKVDPVSLKEVCEALQSKLL